ncbi:MAG: GNAT family N-acetyltransferase [Pseudomonadota bacterium]
MDDTVAIEVRASATSIGEAAWESCRTTNHPFTAYAFFSALEESGCATSASGWQPQHLVIANDCKQPQAIMPCYAKSHSSGEYVFDHSWADAYHRAGGGYYPKLQTSAPFTPATAPRLITRNPELAPILVEGSKALCHQLKLSSHHATFLVEDDIETFRNAGYLIRHDQQFHWYNQGFETFDDFLATLTSRKRKAIKKERREALSADLHVDVLTGGDLESRHWDEFYQFYLDTSNRKWGHPYLNRAFFEAIGESMAEQIVLFLARRGDGKAVAGALNFIGDGALFGRNWGATEYHPFLHFELCYYQAIDYAIAHRLGRVEAGAQGAHKIARGYAPQRTTSAHWIADHGFRDAVAAYLKAEREEVASHIDHLNAHTPFRKSSDT